MLSHIQQPELAPKIIQFPNNTTVSLKYVCTINPIIHIVVTSATSQQYQCEIESKQSCSKEVEEYFQNLKDLYVYLESEENLKVSLQDLTLSILMKSTILKNKEIINEIAKIQLKPKHQASFDDLQQLTTLCAKGQLNFTPKILSNAFLTILKKLETFAEKKDIEEAIDPVINKFVYFGNQLDTLQSKFVLLSDRVDGGEKMEKIRSDIQEFKKELGQKNDRNNEKIAYSFQILERDLALLRKQIKVSNEESEILSLEIGKIKSMILSIESSLQDCGIFIKDIEKLSKIESGFIDKTSPFIEHFEITRKTAKKIKQTLGDSTMLIGTQNLKANPTFKIKLTSLNLYPMYIGIIDSKHKNQQFCQKNDKRFWISTDGICFNGTQQVKMSRILKIGDVISIEVNLAKKKVIIRLNEGKKQLFEYVFAHLYDSKINWLPCVWIGSLNDSVEFVE